MREVLFRASSVAVRRGSTHITLEDLVFLMRRNPVKVQRLIRYLGIKDTAASVNVASNPVDGGGNDSVGGGGNKTNRARRCKDFLNKIDTNGSLSRAAREEIADEARLERLRRLDRIARVLDERRYVEFSKARQAGFLGAKMRHQQRFHDWLTRDSQHWMPGDVRGVDKAGVEVFAYLAYETVGRLTEMSLTVRNEWERHNFQADYVQHSQKAGAVAFNPSFPNVQVKQPAANTTATSNNNNNNGNSNNNSNEPESPLRKRLKSTGNAATTTTPAKQQQQQPGLDLRHLQASHVREAFRRLTQLPGSAMGWGDRLDGRHQQCETQPPIIAL